MIIQNYRRRLLQISLRLVVETDFCQFITEMVLNTLERACHLHSLCLYTVCAS